jgi:cell division protein FtsX
MTAFVSVVILVLYYFNFGIKGKLESVLRITYDVESGALDKLESEIGRLFAESKLINRVLDFGEGAETNVYVVKPGASTDAEEVENALRAVPGIQQVSMYQSDQHAPF